MIEASGETYATLLRVRHMCFENAEFTIVAQIDQILSQCIYAKIGKPLTNCLEYGKYHLETRKEVGEDDLKIVSRIRRLDELSGFEDIIFSQLTRLVSEHLAGKS